MGGRVATNVPSSNPGRRERWARRENERRWRLYEAALAAWQRADVELRQMLASARAYRGRPPGDVPPSVRMRRGETLLWNAPGARMIELRHQPALPPPGYANVSLAELIGAAGQAPPAQANVSDIGAVSVTNQRVIFHGSRHNREWAFAKLVGLAHDIPTSSTLMSVTNRKYVSGLLFEPGASVGFRFNLALGLADATGDRAGFVAHLERLLVQHASLLPSPPALVSPAQAPHAARTALGVLRTAYFGPPGASPRRRTLQGLVTVFLTLGFIGQVLPGASVPTASVREPSTLAPSPSLAPAGAAADVAEPVVTVTITKAPASAPVSEVADPAVTVTIKVTKTPALKPPAARSPRPSSRAKTTTQSRPGRQSEAAPTPEAVPLCDAPENPYGYNFCGGNLITDPKPDTCRYFDCIPYFSEGKGYMIQCSDDTFSMSGGRQGSCSHHGGNRRPVYQ